MSYYFFGVFWISIPRVFRRQKCRAACNCASGNVLKTFLRASNTSYVIPLSRKRLGCAIEKYDLDFFSSSLEKIHFAKLNESLPTVSHASVRCNALSRSDLKTSLRASNTSYVIPLSRKRLGCAIEKYDRDFFSSSLAW